MDKNEMKSIAAKKVHKILVEHGVKISLPLLIKNTSIIRYLKECNKRCAVVYCEYSLKGGAELKRKKNNFLVYFNARVTEEYVAFTFSETELLIEETAEKPENEVLDKVMSKINKLLSITEETGATENEAMIASMRAQELMKEYNIDYVSVTGGTDKKEEIVNIESDTPRGLKWKYSLADYVATSYCCKTFFCGEVVSFRGFKSDVLIARRVYIYLLETAIKLGKIYDKEEKKKAAENGEHHSSVFTSFCVGFCSGVGKRLGENCKALALTIPQLVEDDWKIYSKDFRDTTVKNIVNDYAAYEQGEIEGKRAVNGQYISASDKKEKSRKSGELLLETK